jgi:hypothetical protein
MLEAETAVGTKLDGYSPALEESGLEGRLANRFCPGPETQDHIQRCGGGDVHVRDRQSEEKVPDGSSNEGPFISLGFESEEPFKGGLDFLLHLITPLP